MQDGKNNLDEQLSAWFDDELSAAERAEVAAMLQSSRETQRELTDMARLSELLRDLPPQNAPAELAPSIMQRIEREALLSVASAAAPLVPLKSQSLRRRLWWLGSAAAIATAAGILVMVQLSPLPQEQVAETPGVPVLVEGESAIVAERTPADGVLVTRIERSETAGSSISSYTTPKAAPASPQVEFGVGVAAKSAPVPSADPSAPDSYHEAPSAPAGGLGGGADSRAFVGWGQVQIGDVVPYFTSEGDKMAVVEMTVVDVQEAMGKFEVLLTKNNVAKVDPELAAGQTLANNGALAVYVESTGEQMTAALNEMSQSELFVDLKLQPPTEISRVAIADNRLPAEVQRFAQPLAQIVTEARQKNSLGRTMLQEEGLTESRARASVTDKPALEALADLKSEPVEAPQPSRRNLEWNAAEAKQAPAGAESLAFQVQLNLALPGQAAAAPVAGEADEDAPQFSGGVLAGKKMAGMPESLAPVRVMFVFQNVPAEAAP